MGPDSEPVKAQATRRSGLEDATWWRPCFADPEVERRFLGWQFAEQMRVMLFGFAVIATIALANIIVDFAFYRAVLADPGHLALRLCQFLASVIVLLALVLIREDRRSRWIAEVGVAVILLTGLALVLKHPYYQFTGPISIMIATLAIYLLTPFPWQRQTAYALVYSIAALLGWAQKIGLSGDLSRMTLWLLFINLLGAYVSRRRHLYERRLYAANSELAIRLQTEQQLRQRNSALLDLLTHELRNPLAAIQAQAELLQRLCSDARSRLLAQKISGASQACARLIADWIEGDRLASRGSSLLPTTDAALRKLIEAFREAHPDFPVSLPDSVLPPLMMPAHILVLAVGNLLENAAKYARTSRGLTIRYRVLDRRVRIRIRDYGPGIDPADQQRIFSRHERLEVTAGRPGTGLGLYLVREILESCSGSIRVQSVPGRGSAFLIEIPRV
jgi:signal transduction histidine kinase